MAADRRPAHLRGVFAVAAERCSTCIFGPHTPQAAGGLKAHVARCQPARPRDVRGVPSPHDRARSRRRRLLPGLLRRLPDEQRRDADRGATRAGGVRRRCAPDRRSAVSEPRRRQRYIVLSIEHASVLKGAAQAYQAIMERWPYRQPPGPVLTEAIEAVRAEYRRTGRRVCSVCGGCDYGEPCCLSTCSCRATSPDSPLTNCTP